MSSNKFLSNYFNCPCILSGGKDFMPHTLLNHPEGDILVMYDSLSAGFLEEDIIFEASKRRGKTYIIRPKSFEKYILDSKMINENFTIKKPVHKLEDAYERKLSYVLPFNYSKSSLSPCLLKECNTLNNEKCLSCGYRVPIGKKLEYLSHSGLEYIRVRGMALG